MDFGAAAERKQRVRERERERERTDWTWTALLPHIALGRGGRGGLGRPSVARSVTAALASINFSKLLRYGEIMDDAIPSVRPARERE